MKTIEEQMSFYAAYHQDARNKATHFIGVPAIMLSLFIPLAWIRFDAGGVTITAAMVFAAVVLLYYFFLDVPLALAMLVVTAVLVFVGQQIAGLGAAQGWIWFAILFVGGWILQLVGHVLRGPQARARRQPVPDLRRADLPGRRSVLSRWLQAAAAPTVQRGR